MTQLTQRLGDRLEARATDVQGGLASPVRTPRMVFPTRPTNLYAITRGIHVTVGIAIFPLLFAKLWMIYPRLFSWPPFDSVLTLLERVSIAVLVSAAVLEPVIGLINSYQWYPWTFSFRSSHYGLAWVIVGSIAVHVAVKMPTIVRNWR